MDDFFSSFVILSPHTHIHVKHMNHHPHHHYKMDSGNHRRLFCWRNVIAINDDKMAMIPPSIRAKICV